jgi:hypothetical protein
MKLAKIITKFIDGEYIAVTAIDGTIWFEMASTEVEAIALLTDRLNNGGLS